jgi:hypothetical protein
MRRMVTWADDVLSGSEDGDFFDEDTVEAVEPVHPQPVTARIQYIDFYGHKNVSSFERKSGSDWWNEVRLNSFDGRPNLNHMYPPSTDIDSLIEWISFDNKFVSLMHASYDNESYSVKTP